MADYWEREGDLVKEWRQTQRRPKDAHSHSRLYASIKTSQGTHKPEQLTLADEYNKEIKVLDGAKL